MDEIFWAHARARMMLDPAVANLNTGSFGPLPRPVFERVTELRGRLAEAPMDFLVRQTPPLLWAARQRLASFLGAESKRLVFTSNVTAAINMVASALRLAAPGEILLTDHEYGAMQWCWERAAQRQGLTMRTIALPVLAHDPAEIVAAFRDAMTERTRLLFFSHVLSPTGLVLPARQICAEARGRGIRTVIDGAHGPASTPLDLRELGADFYAGNCHKWLLAPTGTGFLYVAPAVEQQVQPLQVSWGWRYDRCQPDDPDKFGSTPFVRSLEFEGTRDPCAWLAVSVAIEFQEHLGWDRIRSRFTHLADYVRRALSGRCGLTLWTPDHSGLRGPMTAFRLPNGHDPLELRRALWERRIEIPVVERPDGLLLRVSTHFYNTPGEIDYLAEALPAILGAANARFAPGNGPAADSPHHKDKGRRR